MDGQSSGNLLAQVALTVSPFISLPSATTLPYTYKTLPSSLPPSSTADQSDNSKDASRPAFIVSPASGQAANPKDIEASCQKLRAHLDKTRQDAQTTFDGWQQSLKDRELAEKRRVAPGWLDREEKILQPERSTPAPVTAVETRTEQRRASAATSQPTTTAEGEELDRAFGTLGMR